MLFDIHCVPSEKRTNVGRYGFDVYPLILVVFGRNVAKGDSYEMAVYFPIPLN